MQLQKIKRLRKRKGKRNRFRRSKPSPYFKVRQVKPERNICLTENKRSLEYALQMFLGVFNVEMFILNLSAELILRN